MTNEEIKAMIAEMGLPFDHDHPDHITLSKLKSLSPPFLEYVILDHPINADAVRYITLHDLTIRIYSDTEVSECEDKVKEVLESYGQRWTRTYEYIEELLMWCIRYTTQI